jgi:putative transposase
MISMYQRGRCMDNMFIKRAWRSLKHEEIYMKGECRRQRAARGALRLDRLL